jgi:hypothetical protein
MTTDNVLGMSQATNLSPETIRHLSFAKSLYIHALQHSSSEGVLDRAIALMNFDGSVETFLYALVDYLGAEISERAKYKELLDAVRQKLANPTVIQEVSLGNMHIARNDVQHHGIVASFNDVQRYKELTYQTLTKLSKEVLRKDFEEISLSDLIQNSLVKSFYKKAENAYFSGNYKDALFYTACAFEKAKRTEQNKLWGSLLSLHRASSPLTDDKFINGIFEELEVLKLRLDYKQYQKYRGVYYLDLEPFSNIASDTEDGVVKEVKTKLKMALDAWEKSSNSLKEESIYCLSFALNNILMWEQVERADWSEIITALAKGFK